MCVLMLEGVNPGKGRRKLLRDSCSKVDLHGEKLLYGRMQVDVVLSFVVVRVKYDSNIGGDVC